MSSADPTAAARARRYRARQAGDAPVASSSAVELLERVVGELVALRGSVDKLAGAVHNRDAGVTRPAERDVTARHGGATDAHEGAGATPDDALPPGASVVVGVRDAVTAFETGARHGRIIEALEVRTAAGDRITPTVAALADAVELGARPTLEALIELRGLGLVERLEAPDPTQRDRWRLASPIRSNGGQLGAWGQEESNP